MAFHYGYPSNNVRMSFKDWLSWMFDRHPGVRDVVTFAHVYCSELDVLVSNVAESVLRSYYKGCIQNDYGGMQSSYFSCLFGLSAKALVVLHKLRIVVDLGFRFVVLESDARAGLSRAFLECRFAFLERSGNQFAHAVAQKGILRLEDRLWVEEALLLATTLVVVDRRLFDPP
ncbi:hypothetical protein Goarm_013040 [Gossypium armourianum]|uniref:RNase H type-1 domain-containing protein n=1 Tax=Gossypium armourianum TaxID=34283 RepID=A0A7J9J2L7_9ROSI|nr:hypothetical protein [Gossypium armourianum]